MSEKETQHEVIIGYRNVINQRYQYDNIKKKYELPASFDERKIAQLRNYFLNYIYPPPHKREELNDAFHSLDNYIKHPEKLFRILVDSSMLLIKYGRHLPKILKAGINAFRSFRDASKFESNLVKKAISLQLQPPFQKSEINTLLRSLPRNEIDHFMESSYTLFHTLHDRVLIKKIIAILEQLIVKMKMHPGSYSPEEIKGLEIGLDLVTKGDLLFDQLSKDDQQKVFDFIIRLERDVIDEVFLGDDG